MTDRRLPEPHEKQCPKGTFNGEAAKASMFGFARCILLEDHTPPCDSGPASGTVTPEPT